jgi:hypothetical protein
VAVLEKSVALLLLLATLQLVMLLPVVLAQALMALVLAPLTLLMLVLAVVGVVVLLELTVLLVAMLRLALALLPLRSILAQPQVLVGHLCLALQLQLHLHFPMGYSARSLQHPLVPRVATAAQPPRAHRTHPVLARVKPVTITEPVDWALALPVSVWVLPCPPSPRLVAWVGPPHP